MNYQTKLGYYWRLIRSVFQRFVVDGCTYRAAALTFTSLLSIVPLMAVVLAVVSVFPLFKQFELKVQQFVFSNFVPTASEVIQVQLASFARQAHHLSWIGFVFLVVTAMMLLVTIEKAFNAIWQVKTRRRSISSLFLYLSVLVMLPLLMALSVALSDFVIKSPFVVNRFDIFTQSIQFMPFLVEMISFAFLYIVLPNIQVKWRYALIGGFIAAGLFEIAKMGFVFYLQHFPTYTVIYGALAAIPIFLIWIYLSWMIVLFGAEVTNALIYKHNLISGKRLSGFYQAFRWIRYLDQAKQKRLDLSLMELMRSDPDDYDPSPWQQIAALQKAGFVRKKRNNRYELVRDVDTMTVYDLYHSLPWRLPDQTFDDDMALTQYLNQANSSLSERLNVRLTTLF